MLIFFLSLLFFSLDFFLKKIITLNFPFNAAYPLIDKVVYLRLVHNTGIAFGLFQGKTIFIIFTGLIFIGFFSFFIFKEKHTLSRKIFLSMILGGAACNLYDRIFLGYVIDYIDLTWWPVFNLSDTFITIGCSFLIIPLLFKDAGKKT